jgi:hypothetical protein
MLVKLFDIQNGVIVPTEHCYTLKTLKNIMDEHPDDYLQIYLYLFYMTYPNPELNPFFNSPTEDKESIILDEIKANFSTEDDLVIEGLELCNKLYSTPTSRAYNGIKIMLDKLGTYMATTEITHGRDGSVNSLVSAAAKYDSIRQSFKGAYKDLQDELSSKNRGGISTAYDQ